MPLLSIKQKGWIGLIIFQHYLMAEAAESNRWRVRLEKAKYTQRTKITTKHTTCWRKHKERKKNSITQWRQTKKKAKDTFTAQAINRKSQSLWYLPCYFYTMLYCHYFIIFTKGFPLWALWKSLLMSWFGKTRKKMKRSQTMDLCNTVPLNSSQDKGAK